MIPTSKKIHVTPEDMYTIKSILSKNLPSHCAVWVFGSRARGDIKPYSDLDLALDLNGGEIPISVLAALSYDFEESDISYKVDIVDLNTIDNSFRQAIQPDLIEMIMKDDAAT